MTTASATSLLAQAHARMLNARVGQALRANRLLVLTIAAFLGLYCAAAYVLVAKGLDFIHKMPLFGPLLMERLVYLLFFFFFIMLVISNATITGMGLFRRKDMDWQIALPLPFPSLVLWKTLEGMVLASWGLLVLSAPILLALERAYGAGLAFYAAGLPALLCLVALSANVSTWCLLFLVRHARRWWWKIAAVAGAAIVSYALFQFWRTVPEDPTKGSGDLVANLHEVLKHTEICMHPLLPSTWVAETIFAAGRGLTHQVFFFNLALLANALFALVITVRLGSRLFYPAWHRVMAAVPLSGAHDEDRAWYRDPALATTNPFWLRFWGLDRPAYAVILKDIRTFLREPTQWGQSLLIFGLLLMYTSNLRRLGYDLNNAFWVLVISHLNLLVCCLALSTLTTRFIFPQFSMEGQRLWIVGLSPMPLHRVLSLKLRLSAGVIGLLTTGLLIISGVSLELPWLRIVYFCGAVIMMSYGLTALALALGALVPNFREPNPARIISGFGGTLCLIGSFLYILACSIVLALPSGYAWHASVRGNPIPAQVTTLQEMSALGATGFLTVVFGVLPYWIAKKRTKNLDYLKEL
jgi:ABC-2 type transport system permease protein